MRARERRGLCGGTVQAHLSEKSLGMRNWSKVSSSCGPFSMGVPVSSSREELSMAARFLCLHRREPAVYVSPDAAGNAGRQQHRHATVDS